MTRWTIQRLPVERRTPESARDGGRDQPPAAHALVEHRPFPRRLWDATRGLAAAYRDEPNLRFHLFAGGAAAVLARATGLDGLPLLYLLGTITFVFAAELVNTAVERVVDLATGGHRHALAQAAKDMAAGAVLVAALHATAAAWFLFLRPLGVRGVLQAVAGYALQRPLEAAVACATVVALAVMGLLIKPSRRYRR